MPKTWSNQGALGCRGGGGKGAVLRVFWHFGRLKVPKTWSNQAGRTGLLGCRGGGGKGLCSAFSALWRAESAENME